MVASQSSAARDVGSTSAGGSATTCAAAYAIRLLGGPGGSSRAACRDGAYGANEPSACGSKTCSVIVSLLLSLGPGLTDFFRRPGPVGTVPVAAAQRSSPLPRRPTSRS